MMGQLYEECRMLFDELRRLFEDAAGLDLTGLELLTRQEFVRKRILAPENPLSAVVSILFAPWLASEKYFTSPFGYSPESPHAVVVDEDLYHESEFRDMPPAYCLMHEFSHVVHAVRFPSGWKAAERSERRLRTAVREGFAIYFSTMAFDYPDEEVAEYVQEMRDAFFHYGETGEYADIIPTGWRTCSRIEGFLFYHALEQHLGLEGMLKSLDRPPKSMGFIMKPERYLSKNPLSRILA